LREKVEGRMQRKIFGVRGAKKHGLNKVAK
jgi:hypothetical protein